MATLWLLPFLFFGCAKPKDYQKEIDMLGDWWLVGPSGDYLEMYISKTQAFTYDEALGLMVPKELRNVTDTTVGVMANVGGKWMQITSPLRFENDSTLVQEVTEITFDGADTVATYGYTQTYHRLRKGGKRLSDFSQPDGGIKMSSEDENALFQDFLKRMELHDTNAK